jgi:DNA polymerase IIIc chi subunit
MRKMPTDHQDKPRDSETKRQAFVRLATKRTNNILERIRILSNCANSNAYEYSDEDVRKIFSAIDEELRIARSRFQGQRKREFKLQR